MKPFYLIFSFPALFLLALPNPLQASDTDERIEASFKKTFVYQTYLEHDAIKLRCKDGKAVLSGKVAEESHSQLAEEVMAGLPGVEKVENHLTIRGKKLSENSDQWIKMEVETAFLFNRSQRVRKTKVKVTRGVVTLRGPADDSAQKILASDYAAEIEGVTGVKNEMTISEPSSSLAAKTMMEIDDASITALVKVSLLSRRSTSALNTEVKTEKGVVTLIGKAGNVSEKDFVTKLASRVNGVKSVVNNMIVSAAVSG